MAEPTLDVIARAQRGDTDAMADLVTGQQRYVYSIAMSVLRDPEDAADLTQDVFIRLWRVLPSFRGETRFTTWLYRLVTNAGIDALRRRGHHVELSLDQAGTSDDGETTTIDVADTDPLVDPSIAVDRRELAQRVQAAIAELPVHYRLALTLYYFRELRYEEIATVLNLPINTVKAHIRRGKLALASQIASPVAWEA